MTYDCASLPCNPESKAAADLRESTMYLLDLAAQRQQEMSHTDPRGEEWDLLHSEVTKLLRAAKFITEALNPDYLIHDLEADPDDLPDKYGYYAVEVRGTDCIRCRPGESLAEAVARTREEVHYQTVAQYDPDEGWNTAQGYPMMVQPCRWRNIRGFWEEGEEDEQGLDR